MIVIVIIGVVYTLVISKLQNFGEEKSEPSFATLKEYLLSYMDEAKSVELICLDDCSECSIYRDGKKVEKIKSFFDANVQTYRYDFLQGVIEKKPKVFFNKEGVQESVCFSFKVEKNSVSDQVIVLYDGKAYDYANYFTPTESFDSLDELIQERQSVAQEIMQ